jgi:hypothetical protein
VAAWSESAAREWIEILIYRFPKREIGDEFAVARANLQARRTVASG